MRKLTILFAALTLCVGLWAAAPANVEYVDLGLPSGIKWANMNVGATKPEEYGDYFAWGETSPKEVYNWSTYFDTNDGGSTLIKYNNYGGKTTLDPEDDAAHVNWGGSWRMPTKAEQDELRNNCTWKWVTLQGVNGYKVTGSNGNWIFLPASGCRFDSSVNGVGSYGYYWSSSLFEDYSYYAYYFYFYSVNVDWYYNNRYYGRSVRPVTTKSIVPVTPKVGDQFVDTISGLKLEVTAVGDTNTVKVIKNNYTGTSYTVPDTVKYLDVDFAVTEIESVAFAGCSALQSITLSEGLTKIGDNAFVECSALQSVTIPASVTTIGGSAFNGCTALASVTFLGNACQGAIGNGAFSNVGKTDPALLTLPNSWTGTLPDEDGNWYGGVFNLSSTPTALPTLFGDGVKGNKFMHNGQMIIRKGNKSFSILGREMK